jgi:hypothetical protein
VRHDSYRDRTRECLEVEKVVEWVCAGDRAVGFMLAKFAIWVWGVVGWKGPVRRDIGRLKALRTND